MIQQQLDRIVVVDNADYRAVIDTFVMEGGGQMPVVHIEIRTNTPRVIREIRRAFKTFRSCTDAPLFAFEPEPDDVTWERFVCALGFQFAGRVPSAWDGRPRRFFVSLPHGREDHDQHEPAGLVASAE